MFDPATGLRTPIRFLVEGFPILDNASKPANVNEIEVVILICPFFRCVGDLEARVRGYPSWLNRGNVRANYGAIRMLVRKITIKETQLLAMKDEPMNLGSPPYMAHKPARIKWLVKWTQRERRRFKLINIPVPVPMSIAVRILSLSSGAVYSSPSNNLTMASWKISNISFALASLGPLGGAQGAVHGQFSSRTSTGEALVLILISS